MLEPILQSLRDVTGVQGAMIVDQMAMVVAARAHAIYDAPILQQVARSVINAADSLQLIQDDWDTLAAHFAEGKLLFRNLRIPTGKPRRYVLAVIADATLNTAFLGVALRVAAAKLIAELETAYSDAAPNAGAAGTTSGRIAMIEPLRPDLGKSSGVGSRVGVGSVGGSIVGSGSGSGSGVGGSGVTSIDDSSATFLVACTRALAANIGPMAKMLVNEAVRAVCGDRPFSQADGPALIARLSAGISNPDERATFLRATRAL